MKIFNWVHRKFHRNDNIVCSSFHEDELCGDQRTMKKVAVGTQTLLGQEVALVDMLSGWKDGILTIGTLGFDEPLKFFPYNYNELEEIYDDEEEEEENHEEREDEEGENDEESEHYPLVLRASKDSLKEEIAPYVEVVDCEIRPGRVEREEGKRTTLADLFSADDDDDEDVVKRDNADHPSEVVRPKSKWTSPSGHAGKKQALRGTKSGMSFAKKLIPRVGDDSRPIKKLNKLMTRMLKRKIHPELEGKILKSDSQMFNEEVSLLQTQVVAV